MISFLLLYLRVCVGFFFGGGGGWVWVVLVVGGVVVSFLLFSIQETTNIQQGFQRTTSYKVGLFDIRLLL
jgi:hypothetical protein